MDNELPPAQAEQPPTEDSVNVVNPEGKLVSIPSAQAQDALAVGYTEPTEHQLHAYKVEQKYGGLGQQAITGLEGAASAATFGLSTGVEKALGVDPEDIAGREEANPISHGVGQVGGLLASTALLPGAGAVMEGAGSAAAGLVGEGAAALLGTGAKAAYASKIGSAAVKGAVENMLFQSGNEVSKMFSEQSDPIHPIQTAIAHIGLSGLIGGGLGGAFGAASPAWSEGAAEKVSALLEKVKKSPLVEKLAEYTPDGLTLGFALTAMGHPHLAVAVGGGAKLIKAIGKYVGREVPEALDASILKYAANQSPELVAEAGGFKAMYEMIAATMRAENTIGKAASSVFQAGREVLPASLMPSDKNIEKLDDRLKELQLQPEDLMNASGDTSTYLPNHGPAIGQTATNAVNLLNSLRPTPGRQSPLDADPEVSAPQKAEFKRALSIGQQPLMTLEHMKNGTLLPQDVTLMKALYPALYQNVSQKLVNNMLDTMNKKQPISYQTRLGLSMFLGRPLDSTMTPAGITAAQLRVMPRAEPAGGKRSAGGGGAHSMKALGQLPKMQMTNLQSRSATRYK